MQARSMPNVKLRSLREASRLAAERRVVKNRKRSGWSSSSVSEEKAKEGTPRGRRRVEKESKSPYGEVPGEKSTKFGCPKPDAAVDSARRVGSSSGSVGRDGIGSGEIYSSESDPNAVKKVTSLTAWRKNVTAK